MLDHTKGELIVNISTSKRSADFVALLAWLDQAYGRRTGRTSRPVVLVLDDGPSTTSSVPRNRERRTAARASISRAA